MPMKNPAYLGAIALDRVDVTAASGAATRNGGLVRVTSAALTTAAAAEYTLTLTNTSITADSTVFASVGMGTATEGTPAMGGVTVSAGQAVITVTNVHATQALNGTIVIDVLVLNPKGT